MERLCREAAQARMPIPDSRFASKSNLSIPGHTRYPLMHPRGFNFTTLLEMPAMAQASTTLATSL